MRTPKQRQAITKVKLAAQALQTAISEAQAEGIIINPQPFAPLPTPLDATMIDILTAPPLSFRFFLHPRTPQPEQPKPA